MFSQEKSDGKEQNKPSPVNGEKDIVFVPKKPINFIPPLEFCIATLGAAVSIFLVSVIYETNQKKMLEVEKSIDSLHILVDSFRYHINNAKMVGPETKDGIRIEYDTLIIPHDVYNALKKMKTKSNPK